MFKACYPGSFDPLTSGHLDLIERAAGFCSELVVAVVHNPNKRTLFSLEERCAILEQALGHLTSVRVDFFSGLLVEYLKLRSIPRVIRGLRDSSDAALELQMARLNQQMEPQCETLWLAARPEFAHISSSFVREIARLQGDFTALVPPLVVDRVKAKLASGGQS